MIQEFNSARNVYLDLDNQKIVRQLIHTHAPVAVAAATPQLAAANYLGQYAGLFGVSTAQLANLSLEPSPTIEDAPVEYRFLQQKNQFDSTTVAFYQTDLGLPVWQAGISVQMRVNPFRVLTSQSTLHPNLEVTKPTADAVKRAEAITEEELAQLLGLDNSPAASFVPDTKALRIEKKTLVIYQYESANRVVANAPPREQAAAGKANEFVSTLPTLPLPEVSDKITEGDHYVCVKIDFELPVSPIGALHWVAIVDVQTLSVLYLRALVDCVNGLVFEDDPITTNGGPLPTAGSAALNAVRVSDTLPGLIAPSGGTQSLTGNNVILEDVEAPTVAPPTESGATAFNFDARSDNFAAVNAYYHCDKFFRLLDGMGFTQSGYFGHTTFPTPVDHRGSIGTANGVEVNAHCMGNTSGEGILRTTFALADTSNTTDPIGIACDYRVVLHELSGHGTLWNHVNSPNFGFSHSAGDSIAAILNDPGTKATDRFETFPWVYASVNRRHDRTPAAGWGWEGQIALNPFDMFLDDGGYNNEQILSTSHFRIYRSIGGDSTDLPTQQFAARVVTYLILRAIATLTPATNAADAAAWVTALTTADAGDWVSENLTGGAYSKVIRWAFEKQGLYQPSGTATPNNNVGSPPAVDVYVDDGRGGEYTYQPNFWSNQSIWNRLAPDGGTAFQTPVTNQPNYAYVTLKNRGSQTATNVTVKAYHANPAAGLSYPNDWVPMITSQLSAANVPPNSSGEITVGPFEWIPTNVGHECLFMVVSATGDSSNVDNINAGDSIPEWRLVPNDNNVGQRNVFPITGSGTSGLTKQFNSLTFNLKNPMLVSSVVEVRPQLPAFLVDRGWKIEFLNAGGASFRLQPGESQDMIIRLVPGADFTPADVNSASDQTIHLYGYAGGILVGGMSYVIDPNLKVTTGGGGQSGACNAIGTELLKCIDVSKEKITKIRVRKVNVDLDFEAEDCGCSE
ncbi:hypothetical protein [Granulicella mallensis]|uniref:Uncharacterized protein n=1 Tax=Granulicella mallensis (strain ATCC BAA-1857 / DSM 23137 / MP5ACTX8) TaxID=682795 RepID=G8P1J5_GRAMM|nr:hypothetical protein [Granulicella mallensis]AEU34734.1 hypothetical protein AciX8_0379 [Granulicella mallensis MP5ACTX8]